jgi:hypothetical protein
MKNSKIVLPLLSMLLMLFSCNDTTIKIGPGSGTRLEGNGKVSSVNREIGPFDKIEISGVFNVFLIQGTAPALKVETDENLQDLITSSVQDNTLKLGMKDSTRLGKRTKMNVYVTLTDLKKLKTKSVGNVSSMTILNLDELEVECASVGTTNLMLNADKLTMKLDIVGAVNLSGKVKHAEITHNGVGAVNAFPLEAEYLSLKANGVGTAEVNALKELHVKASGIGSVRYKGEPAVKDIENNGIGKVSKI